MSKLNAWIDAGIEFGEKARKEMGMLCSDSDATIKMALVINGMTLALPVKDRTATAYSFSDDKFLYVIAHHYNHPDPENNGLLMVCFPILQFDGKTEGDVFGIVYLATAFLGINPGGDFQYVTKNEMVGA